VIDRLVDWWRLLFSSSHYRFPRTSSPPHCQNSIELLCGRPGSPQNRRSSIKKSVDWKPSNDSSRLPKPCLPFELLAVLISFSPPLWLCIWLSLGDFNTDVFLRKTCQEKFYAFDYGYGVCAAYSTLHCSWLYTADIMASSYQLSMNRDSKDRKQSSIGPPQDD
jgi:hypothetical protein